MQATSYPTQPGVQGQTVYVHQPAPVNYTTSVQNPNSNSSGGVSEKFNGAAGRATGWIQLCLGIGSIVICIAEIVLHTSVGFSGMGIWASVLFYIPSGILGICTMKKNTCVIIAYLTMSIIAAIIAFFQIIAGGVGTGIVSFEHYFYECEYDYSFYPDWFCDPGVREGRVAADAMLAIMGFIEMVVAIVGSAYCCGGMACGTSSTRTTTTVYTQQANPMVVTTGQYAQPGTVQPPPYQAQQAYPPAGQYNNQVPAPAPYTQAPAPAPYTQAAPAGAQAPTAAAAIPTKDGQCNPGLVA